MKMPHVSKRLRSVAGSATLDISEKVTFLKEAGVRVYDLGIGEADYRVPRPASEALADVALRGRSRYTEVQGTPQLRESICLAVNSKLYGQLLAEGRADEPGAGAWYDPSEIVVSVGSKHLQYSALLALCDPGDEVVLQAPYWVSYPDMVRLAGAEPVVVPSYAEEGFVPPVERIADAITPRTRLVFLNSPNNPTGRAWSAGQIAELCELILAHDDLYLLSDEIYGPIVFGGVTHVSPSVYSREMRERVILTDGLSKAYSMGGWRVGFACVPNRDLLNAFLRIGANTISAVPSVTQDAAVHALGAADRVEEMRADFERRAALMDQRLNAMGLPTLPPQGAFYAFADVSSLFGADVGGRVLRTTGDVAWAFLEDAGVASVAGEAFGDERHIRFSFVRPLSELEAACDALEAFVLRCPSAGGRRSAGRSVTAVQRPTVRPQ
jgi:aspartate aminotransferase